MTGAKEAHQIRHQNSKLLYFCKENSGSIGKGMAVSIFFKHTFTSRCPRMLRMVSWGLMDDGRRRSPAIPSRVRVSNPSRGASPKSSKAREGILALHGRGRPPASSSRS
ncbi:unnamed protein product [Symbiodinium natans]|uniref:Uncharacterized protein n=1 Tax=Symbiodinium natans TaxID=878477 RepID=A0A812U2Z7_9DINO|nr:unnamed protein product [Symbiodinium natans]